MFHRHCAYATAEPPRVRSLAKPLEGGAKVQFCICLSQAPFNAGETSFSLQFGERMARLRIAPERSRPQDAVARVLEYFPLRFEFPFYV